MKELINSLKYTFKIYSHPFDGFWFLKAEKRATVKTGFVLLVLLLFTTSIRVYTTGYIFSSLSLNNFSIWLMVSAILGIVLLYCVANWALTTLTDGKGTIAEIFISLMYCLTPVIIMNLPLTILSNFVTEEGIAFYNFLNIIIYIWSVFLLLVANYSIHDFTMVKSVITLFLTLIFMLLIAVVGILFFNLCQEIFVWISSIFQEIAYRL